MCMILYLWAYEHNVYLFCKPPKNNHSEFGVCILAQMNVENYKFDKKDAIEWYVAKQLHWK